MPAGAPTVQLVVSSDVTDVDRAGKAFGGNDLGHAIARFPLALHGLPRDAERARVAFAPGPARVILTPDGAGTWSAYWTTLTQLRVRSGTGRDEPWTAFAMAQAE